MNNRNLAVGIPQGGSSFHCFHWNLECFFMWREENRRTRRKTLAATTRTNINSTHMSNIIAA